MEYLAEAYQKDDSLLPKDPKAKAIIHARVHFEIGTLYPRFLMTYIHPRFFGKEISPDNVKLLDETLAILDQYLSLKKWIAADHMTIADISLVVVIGSIQVCAVWYTLISLMLCALIAILLIYRQADMM